MLPCAQVSSVPIINLQASAASVAQQIHAACIDHGFFYVVGHGLDAGLCQRLDQLSAQFFALPEATKAEYAMALGGRAWRGWFPLGSELTSGRPDWKQGLYLGSELTDEHPKVRAGVPLHGRNLMPGDDVLPNFRQTIFDYMAGVTSVGHRVLAAIALSLGLPANFFEAHYTADPLILFRIFQYPSIAVPAGADVQFGVGEHTDYGLVTLLRQDDVGGLEVKTRTGWIDAAPIPNSLVCNIGDMLDRMTAGYYRSTPHRVRINTSGRDRLSFPLFFDPNFDARIAPIRTLATDDAASRWDGASVHNVTGTYGDYLVEKIGKVFPVLRNDVLA